jgi:hypothetical protein
MTLEQIVNTHPCPIIRGKIMENVDKTEVYTTLDDLIFTGIIWHKTKEGTKFWQDVFKDLIAPYSDLKHLDLSYVPKPALPPVMWRKIDANDIPTDTVVAMHIDEPTIIFMGSLELDRHNEITIYIGNGQYLPNFTHYIALSDLSSLPIE